MAQKGLAVDLGVTPLQDFGAYTEKAATAAEGLQAEGTLCLLLCVVMGDQPHHLDSV